jgi:hypothetical protein
MENKELVSGIPMSGLAERHQQIIEKYKDVTSDDVGVDPQTKALMAFNGYYTLNTAAGAFFAIDTNVYIKSGSNVPTYVLDFLVSMDGKTSVLVPFNGTFDGTHLLQQSGTLDGVDINLTFTRTDGSDGTTVLCSGTIALAGKSAVAVQGSTYNNPIPLYLFRGDYYEISPNSVYPLKVMSIGESYQLLYDGGSNNGVLKPVPTYVYNLNMYYFSFNQGSNAVSLIMGTASSNGFACNNMVVASGVVTTRALLTIPKSTVAPFKFYDIGNSQLAGFSGYYQIPSTAAPLAFVSIQAQYATALEIIDWDLYFIMISVSLDGVTCNGYYYDPFTMTFENNTLTMPNQGITITFTRKYDPDNGSLVTINAVINGKTVKGNTLFNPVPLTVFGGVPMTNSKGDTLTVTNNNEVVYNNTNMDGIIYVPLMYILAYPKDSPKVLMSFGTDGLKGNTCIVTDNRTGTQITSVVNAIPTPPK